MRIRNSHFDSLSLPSFDYTRPGKVWYSTCYRRALHRNFDSDACPISVCGLNAATKDWKFGGRCISCAAAEANAVAAAPHWVVLPADECIECSAPLHDGPVYEGGGGLKTKSWSMPDGSIEMTWSHVGGNTDAFTFSVTCAGCTNAAGWCVFF